MKIEEAKMVKSRGAAEGQPGVLEKKGVGRAKNERMRRSRRDGKSGADAEPRALTGETSDDMR